MTARRLAALALASALLAAGCAKDDGATTRGCDTGSGSGASGPSSSCDGGSGSGITEDAVAGTSDNPLVQDAVEGYQSYVEEQVDGLVIDARVFTDAVRANDIEAAKVAYPTSRIRWERIEPIAGLIGDTDGAVDARAEDGVEDDESPQVTGWHQLEYDLWVTGDVSDSAKLADGLDDELEKLQAGLDRLEITPLAVAQGASELIEEVADGKITGEEDRYSHTDLWDLAANVDGAKAATDLLMPAIAKADPDLAKELTTSFADADDALAPYREGDGWKSFEAVTARDRTALKAKFAGLAETLGDVPGALELS